MNLSLSYLDFPTAWAIQKAGVNHTDPRCSAVQTSGAVLCDCGAIESEWKLRRRQYLDSKNKQKQKRRERK